MATCRKCYAERLVARVKATLDYRVAAREKVKG